MTVYLVLSYHYNNFTSSTWQIEAVFSTREKAEEYVKYETKNDSFPQRPWAVQEHEVDKVPE